ncbi:MAG TPA: hypothetical protein VFN57_12785 [Thermomicrobiaceae bacterium]|nr:hypothetical protein [Thermomicrobiaceae bacterium]
MELHKRWRLLVTLALIVLMAMPATALAAGRGGGGNPGNGSGGGGTSVPNNLSVPAIFVGGSSFTGVTCDGSVLNPSGTPSSGYEVAGSYYVQGVSTWHGQCTKADTATGATIDWGDNLVGTALKSGAPIRVEVGILDEAATGTGFHVVKLQPSLSDKDSAYGTTGAQVAFPYPYTTTGENGTTTPATDYVRFYDSGATFGLTNTTTGQVVVSPGTKMTAEINATGKIVYGYNWGGATANGVQTTSPTAGTYLLTFTAPKVTFSGFADPDSRTVVNGDTATLTFTVSEGSGSGSGGNGGNPGNGSGGGGGETTVPNNLSVPTVFVGTNPFGLTCPSGPIAPSGTTTTGYELSPTTPYYVQGVNIWQGQCTTADSLSGMTVDWGDNLVGTALQAGIPIRVEIGILDPAAGNMTGYHVVKLQPSLTDRESAYGTLGDPLTFPYTYDTIGEEGTPTTATDLVRAYDAGATFSLQNITTGAYVVQPGTPATAEINATGKVVYGYNWGASSEGGVVNPTPEAGTYVLTFTAPNISFSGFADPDSQTVVNGDTATLTFTVAASKSSGSSGNSGGGETSVANNLSVPAVFVGGSTFAGVTCPGSAVAPNGTPTTGYEVSPTTPYYVQGVNTWQGQCATEATVSGATVDWGDNLVGTALKEGTPIRVEVGILDPAATGMTGYHVIKLQPSLSDKLSAYGTLGNQETFPFSYDTVGEEGTTVQVTDLVRAYDAGATFSLRNTQTGAYVVPAGTLMTAEINATGKVVYGYNWGGSTENGVQTPTPTAGTYVLTFTAPNVTFSDYADAGSRTIISADGHTVTLTFTVGTSKGSGSGTVGGGGGGGGSGSGSSTLGTSGH